MKRPDTKKLREFAEHWELLTRAFNDDPKAVRPPVGAKDAVTERTLRLTAAILREAADYIDEKGTA